MERSRTDFDPELSSEIKEEELDEIATEVAWPELDPTSGTDEAEEINPEQYGGIWSRPVPYLY